jgi:rod shape determining protein RodA
MRQVWQHIQQLCAFFWMPFILSLIGLLCLYSSASTSGSALQSVFIKQILWWCIGWGLYVMFLRIPMQLIVQSSYLFYGLAVLLLLALFPFGSGPAGRWLDLGFFRIQPSEIAKLATLLAIARCFSADQEGRIPGFRYLLVLFLALLPAALVLIQPDAATAIIFVVICAASLYWAGLRVRVWMLVGIAALAGLTGVSKVASLIFFGLLLFIVLLRYRHGFMLGFTLFCLLINRLVLKLLVFVQPYQLDRIRIFFGLKADPFGSAYQVIQSKIAIGSGGFFGKGYLRGSQTQLRFLPEQHTDFIVSVLGEEFGFLGIFIVLSLFFWYLFRIFQLAETVQNRWAGYAVFCTGALLLSQIIVNAGMTIGLFPVMGLPLPFFSYGGSALCMVLSLSGLIGNCVLSRRYYSN